MTRRFDPRRAADLHPLAWTYVALAFLGSVSVFLGLDTQVLPTFAFLLWLLYLGPVGVVTSVFGTSSGLTLNTISSAPDGSLLVLEAVVVLIFTGVAWCNVLVLRRLSRADSRPATEAAGPQHRVATAVLFSFAGAAFVLLSLIAGFLFLVAPGIDVPTPDPVRIRLESVAAITWLIGLVAAVGGLVVWIRGARQQRPTLRWAVADLSVLVALMAAVIVDASIGTD